jgi:hypothetical protein
MRKQSLPLDPFSLTQITLAIWTTDLLVARKITQAISEQNALIARAMHRRPLTRAAQLERKTRSRDRRARNRAGSITAPASLELALVYGESGDHEALLTTPLAGVPVDAHHQPSPVLISDRDRPGFIFQRTRP